MYCRIGSGSFSKDGVLTNSSSTEDSLTTVHCLSNHTTSFAVLVDVGGGLHVCTCTYASLNMLQNLARIVIEIVKIQCHCNNCRTIKFQREN